MGSMCCPHRIQQTTIDRPASVIYKPNEKQIRLQTEVMNPLVDEQSMDTDPQHLQSGAITGEIDLPDGSKYKGFLKNGIPHGYGTQFHQNGDKYNGDFVEGVKEGQGKYEYANGASYMGEFHMGDITGKGKMQWLNGDWYEGSFKNNIINGYGKYYSKQNNSYYEGTYLDGKRHGKGKISSQGNELAGYWEMGVFKFKKVVNYDPI